MINEYCFRVAGWAHAVHFLIFLATFEHLNIIKTLNFPLPFEAAPIKLIDHLHNKSPLIWGWFWFSRHHATPQRYLLWILSIMKLISFQFSSNAQSDVWIAQIWRIQRRHKGFIPHNVIYCPLLFHFFLIILHICSSWHIKQLFRNFRTIARISDFHLQLVSLKRTCLTQNRVLHTHNEGLTSMSGIKRIKFDQVSSL